MRVLFINTVFGKGSTGRIVMDIGQVLEENGHEYVALYGREPMNNDRHAVFIGNKCDAKVHAGLSRITDRCGFYSKKATEKAIDFIREYNPDVIHLHNLHGYYVNVEILFNFLKKEFKGRVVWTLHDCWAFTGHCVHYSFAGCDKWKKQCSNCPERRRYPSSYLIDNSVKNYQKKKDIFCGIENMVIATPSYWLKEQVKQSFLKNYECAVINNGVDLSVFTDKGIKKQEQYILYIVDGLDERKGYSDIVRISQVIEKSFKTILIGATSREVSKVPRPIIAISRTESQEELAEYYRGASYLINTTYEDTFPTVNLESLACGTPIITYDNGGSPEIVTSDVGYVVASGDKDKIIDIILNQKMPDRDKCRERALKYDKWSKYQEYMTLYTE